MTETGLFFGSFNPVHIGHLAIANYITEYSSLKEIWFVVSPRNPLKDKESLLDERHRLYITELAIGDDLRFRVSDIEFGMPKPSYTIDTLTLLTEKYPLRRFSIIMGEDNLTTLHKWKNPEILVKRWPIIVYPRPSMAGRGTKRLQEILSRAEIQRVDAPVIGISGSFIRNAIREGRDIPWFVPAPAWRYIREMHFYEGS